LDGGSKTFLLIPSWLLAGGSYGYPVAGSVEQQWDQFTGRAAVNWTPQLDFTNQTLVYGSYAYGYKAGGANPPPPVVTGATFAPDPIIITPAKLWQAMSISLPSGSNSAVSWNASTKRAAFHRTVPANTFRRL